MHRLIAIVATLLLSASALAHAPRASVGALPFGEPTRIEQAERQAEAAAPEPHALENLSRQQKTGHRAHARQKHAESVRASALTHCLILEKWFSAENCALGRVKLGHTGYQREVDDSYQAIARWYRPGIGRFQSMDPIDGDPMQPVTFNEYLAFHGTPTGVVDPDGRCGVAAAAITGMGFGAACDVIDSYMIGTSNREALREYRYGAGVGAVRSAVEGVIGGVQLAGDLARAGRMSPMSAEKLAAMNRVGAVGAGIAEVASDPSLALTDYAEDRTTRFRSAVATEQYGKAGEVIGQTQLEVGSAGTGIAGGVRTATGLATRGANKVRAALNGNTSLVLTEAPDGSTGVKFNDVDGEAGVGQIEHPLSEPKAAAAKPTAVPDINPGTRFYVAGNGETLDARTYARNSSFRAGVRDQVWADAVDPETGLVSDPLTSLPIDVGQKWDMGHRPGMEYWKERNIAIQKWLESRTVTTRSEFLDRMNDPKRYRPELPSSNRSHKAEDATNDFWE